MIKHSPAPWKKQTGDNEDSWEIYSDDNKSGWSSVAIVESNRLGQRPVSPEEAEANSDLIAAGPDMFAALNKLVARFEFAIRHADFNTKNHEAIQQARAAMAKAKPWTLERMLIPATSEDRRSGFVVNGPQVSDEPGSLPVRICDLRCTPESPFPVTEANGHLIKAAPDMLAALELVLTYLGDWNAEDEACVAVHAAIEKAKGIVR